MNFRVGLGHDTHRVGAERPLWIGGVEIPHPKGLIGHSDADVLLHAVTDAILGATGNADIGEWFPDHDPANRDRNSREFLKIVVEQCLPPPARIVNLDCILFAQEPKLSVHKPAIRQSLADLLRIPPEHVNVKAKTGEKVGPIGRCEAISAEVVVLVDLGNEGKDA